MRLSPATLLMLLLAALPGTAEAQDPSVMPVLPDCSAYDQAVAGIQPPPSATSVEERRQAVSCLMRSLNQLATQVSSPEIPQELRDPMNRASGALALLIGGEASPWSRDVINDIRRHDSPETASLLAFGARSPDRTTRLNSTLLLADIVDNSTVCVVMDHLADPALDDNGRINLFATASVVAPWADGANYKNMENLADYLSDQALDRKDFVDTAALIELFRQRLAFQDKLASPAKQDAGTIECQQWKPLFADNPLFHIDYSGQPADQQFVTTP